MNNNFKLRKEKKKTMGHLAVRLSESDEIIIRQLARDNKMKVSAVMRQCVEYALESMELQHEDVQGDKT